MTFHRTPLVCPDRCADNSPAAVNPVAEIGVSNIKADSRHTSGIFTSVTPLGASVYGGPGWGSRKARRFLDAGTPTLPSACHPDWRRVGGFDSSSRRRHHV